MPAFPEMRRMMDTFEKYQKFVITNVVRAVAPIVAHRGRGAILSDPEGREYIDCFAGIAVTNCGHGNEEILSAARAQMEKLVHCCSYVYHSEKTADLAEALAEIMPGGLTKTFFCNSGAEAVEGAMRLAKRFTRGREFIALQLAFHGRTYATLSVSGRATRKRGGGPYMPGVAFAPAPYCYRCPLGLTPDRCGLRCAHAVEDVICNATSESVAAFIAEPVMGEGGIIVPPDGYFETVKRILDKHGILFIADEVQSGFGRTGRMFAIEWAEAEPDIITCAKAMANGFPLGAFCTRSEIAAAFQPGDHLSTFGGNPVSCAASLATIAVLRRENLPGRALAMGERVMSELRDWPGRVPRVGDVRGRGLMIGVELVRGESKTPAAEEAREVGEACRKRGLLIGVGGAHGNVLRIQPPLVIEEEELDTALRLIRRSLEKDVAE